MASPLAAVPEGINSASDPAALAVAALCNGVASKVQCARALARVACPSCDVLGELPSDAVDALKRRLTAWFAAFAVLARSPSQAAGTVSSAAVQTAGRGLQSNGSASGAAPGTHDSGADVASGSGSTVIIVIMVSIIALVSLFAGGVVYLYVLRPLNERRARAASGARATPTGSASEPGIDAEAAAIEDSIISSTRFGSGASSADRRSSLGASGPRRQALHVHRTSSSSTSRSTMGSRLGVHEVEVSSARSDRDPECDAADSATAAGDNDDPTGPPVPSGSLAHSASTASSAGPQQLAQADSCYARAASHGHSHSRQRPSPLARAAGTRLFATLQAYANYSTTSPRNQALGRATHGLSRLGLQPDDGQAAATAAAIGAGAGSYLSGSAATSRLQVAPRGSSAARSPLGLPRSASGVRIGALDSRLDGSGTAAADHHRYHPHAHFDSCDADDTFPTAPTPTCSGAPAVRASIRIGAAIAGFAASPRHEPHAGDAATEPGTRLQSSAATAAVAAACQLDQPPLRAAAAPPQDAGELSARGTRSARTATLELVSVATPAAEDAADAAAESRAAAIDATNAACSARGRASDGAGACASVACEA